MINSRYKKLTLTFGVLAILLNSSCENTNSPEPEGKGLLEVVITTSGEDYQFQTYSVHLNETDSISSDVNGKVYFPNLDEGEYTVSLKDMANNCSVNGENPKKITVSESTVSRTTFSVTCNDIVLRNKFVCRWGSDIFEGLFILDDDGSNPVQLTSDSWDSNPAISPDGTKVAFVNGYRDAVDDEFNNEIYVVDASGSPITRLTHNFGSVHDDNPAWSPDGKKLAFDQSDERTGRGNIIVMNADGSKMTQLTNGSYHDSHPTWSPDGSKIAFKSLNRPPDYGVDIFVMNADGTDMKQLTGGTSFDGSPVWSPEGKYILFQRQKSDADKLFIMNADGANIRQLTNDSVGEAFGSWSPDGGQIIFNRFGGSGLDIYRINIDGSALTNITNTPAIGEKEPSWSPVE